MHSDGGDHRPDPYRAPLCVSSVRPFRKGLLVRFAGIGDRTAAEALRGLYLLRPLEALAPLEDDEVFYHQLLGMTVETGRVDRRGNPILRPKYGLHALRHFYASWMINRKKDGGLELPAKKVQERLGHSSIVMTLDVYGHLFPDTGDEFDELAAAERALLG